jgi:hypothetical protein
MSEQSLSLRQGTVISILAILKNRECLMFLIGFKQLIFILGAHYINVVFFLETVLICSIRKDEIIIKAYENE